MTNMKLADELLSIRQKIKTLKAREDEIKEAMQADPESMSGNFAVAFFVKKATSRFDRKAAEAEVRKLDRFDVKGETVALMVNELVGAED